MWVRSLACSAAVAAAACGGGDARPGSVASRTPGASPQPHEAPAARSAPSRCTPAAVRRAGVPRWARLSGVPAAPPTPYVVGAGDRAAGFLFVYPLRVGLPAGAANKILWALDGPGAPLRITARRPGQAGAALAIDASADGGAGRVQRSRVRFPHPGCWRLELRWGARRATLNVAVGK